MTKFRSETAKLKAALTDFRTELPQQVGETIEFQAQLSELKGASAKQKSVTVSSLSKSITATCDKL
jgi:hypothetical protein